MDRPRFTRADWVGFALCLTVGLAAVVWAVGGVVRSGAWRDPIAWVVLVPGTGGVLAFLARWGSLPLMRVPEPMAPPAGWRVAAVTTFVPGLESVAMLRRTVTAMVAMDYPHDTWVLDEGDDAQIRRLCEELGARYFTRRGIDRYNSDGGEFAARSKHGNYNAWLDALGYDGYDVVVGFDPDHIPAPVFLERTLGYLQDDRIGYVQSAQVYYNQSAGFIARGAAEETYGYYSSVQMASYALGYPIVTGCHNVHRTTALREVGGFAYHDADDLLITVLYRAAGWRGVYVPEQLASGITPVDWSGYLMQQRRWARSVLDVKLRELPKVAGKLPFTERIVSAAHGLYYLHGLATAIGVGALTVALAGAWQPQIRAGAGQAAVLVGALLACEVFRQRFYLDRRREWGLHLRAGVLKFAKWPTVLLALLDVVRPGTPPYAVTAKLRQRSPATLRRQHGAALTVVGAGALAGVLRGLPPSGGVAVVATVFVVATALVMATEILPAPDPYDDALAARRVPWTHKT